MTGSDLASPQLATPSTRSWLRRLLLAQEAGLVLVILVLAAILAIAGGTKKKIDRIPLIESSAVSGSVAAQVSETDSAIQVTTPGRTREYDKADGWELRPRNAEGRMLYRERAVNKFLDLDNLFLQLVFCSFIAIMAVGITAVIAMGGIDLSIGSIYALAALFGAMSLRSLQANALGLPYDSVTLPSEGGASLLAALPVALLVCCGTGALCGLFNGAMIVGLRVHPFIITLGTMAAFRGLVAIPTQAQSVGSFPESFTRGFFKMSVGGVNPVPVAIMLLVGLVGVFVLARTVLGRRVYAIGGNEVAARYAGIPVGKVKILVYTIMGALAGLSACVYLGYLGAAETNAGNGYELKVIAAAVIGGASLSGGRGSALGAILGALLVQLIDNGMLILDIDQNYNQIVMGSAIILAVVLDQLKTRLMPGAGR